MALIIITYLIVAAPLQAMDEDGENRASGSRSLPHTSEVKLRVGITLMGGLRNEFERFVEFAGISTVNYYKRIKEEEEDIKACQENLRKVAQDLGEESSVMEEEFERLNTTLRTKRATELGALYLEDNSLLTFLEFFSGFLRDTPHPTIYMVRPFIDLLLSRESADLEELGIREERLNFGRGILYNIAKSLESIRPQLLSGDERDLERLESEVRALRISLFQHLLPKGDELAIEHLSAHCDELVEHRLDLINSLASAERYSEIRKASSIRDDRLLAIVIRRLPIQTNKFIEKAEERINTHINTCIKVRRVTIKDLRPSLRRTANGTSGGVSGSGTTAPQ